MNALTVEGLALRGVCCALPEREVGNEVFVERFGKAGVADVAALTGVTRRFWAAPGQTAGDLCAAAAERLLASLGWARDSVDALIFVSQTPDQRMPATACLIHGRLALPDHCQAFDVAVGCSGYVYGIWLAAALIRAGCRRVLLLSGDTISRLIEGADRGTAMLFGDAGSASGLEASDGAPAMHFVLGSDGRGAPHLAVPGGGFRQPASAAQGPETLAMNGAEVFGFTLTAVPRMIRQLLDVAGRDSGEVDVFAVHQANRFILTQLARKLRVEPDRMPVNVDRFGNTSSATIPLLLCTDLASRMTSIETDLLLAGFGVGFSWAAAMLPGVRLHSAEWITA